jgi:hypothetical protein
MQPQARAAANHDNTQPNYFHRTLYRRQAAHEGVGGGTFQ